MNEFGCEMCKYKCRRKMNLERHMLSNKHLELEKKLNSSEGSIPTQKGFYCETCEYHCDKQYDYTRHLNTQKHIHKTQNNGSASRQNYSETTVVSTELIQTLQQNNELLKMLIDDQRQSLKDLRKTNEEYAELLNYYKSTKHMIIHENLNI